MRTDELLERGSRRLIVGGLLVLAVLGVSVLMAGPAAAAPSTPSASATPSAVATPTVVDLSKDGVVWSPTLTGGLFDKFQGMVPGDRVSTSFYVRNPLDEPITMTTRAINVTSTSARLGNSITVDGTANGLSLAAPISFASLSNCSTLAPDLIIAPNAVAKVSIAFALMNVNGLVATSSRGGFDVLLTMQDNEAGLPATSCDSAAPTAGNQQGGTGTATTPVTTHHRQVTTTGLFAPLAFTGISAEIPLFFAGALFTLGIILLLARRRRKKSEQS
jgi:hypothetical protein